MTEPKKKKKHCDPQLLFPENQAFMDGKLLNPVNSQDMMDVVARQYHLSTHHNFLIRGLFVSLGTVLVLFALGFGWGLSTMIIEAIRYSELTVVGILIFLAILAIFTAILIFIYYCVVAVNYRPGRVNALYRDWLKRGRIVDAEIHRVRWDRGKVTHIEYQAVLEHGEKIIGEFSTKNINMQSADLFAKTTIGMPIYILYADKRLHIPL